MGRRSTLTTEIVTQLEVLWQLSGENTLTDLEICGRIGITLNQLNGWLRRNRSVVRENGEREQLRRIRTRAKATTKSSYLQKHYSLMMAAEAARDYRTAIAAVQWLLEKQFPKDFGNRPKADDIDPDSYGVLLLGQRPDEDEWLQRSKQVHDRQKQQMAEM